MINQRGSVLAGKYELIAPIGQGGMASVWRARTLGASGFSRKVAIKRVLSSLTTDPAFVNMFLEEARVVSELQHPNIVQVHDFDQDAEGNYFIVLEWVEGMDLKQYVIAQERTQAPTPWHLVTAIAIEVLRALQAAHGRLDEHAQPAPVFHRDVNPANILLGVNGIVKLADFGLARASDRKSMTDPGVVKGKVGYMSPELVQGKAASAKSDLYAVGICLWESLTQKKLFYGRSLPETAMMVLKGEVPWLGHEREDLPQELVETVHIALAANPDHRYESAQDMLRALCNVLRTHPEPTDSAPLALSVRRAIALLSAL
jgi:eukaryotic-like serine/threonine-protein kinase